MVLGIYVPVIYLLPFALQFEIRIAKSLGSQREVKQYISGCGVLAWHATLGTYVMFQDAARPGADDSVFRNEVR